MQKSHQEPPQKNIINIDVIIDRLSKISTFLSTVIIGIIGLICTSLITMRQHEQNLILAMHQNEQTSQQNSQNSILDRDKLIAVKLDVMKSFIQPLSEPKTRYIAITTIAALEQREIALAIALMYPEDGNATAAAVSILKAHSGTANTLSGASPYLENSIDFIEGTIKQYDLDIRNIVETSKKMADAKTVKFISSLYDPLSAQEKADIANKPIKNLSNVLYQNVNKRIGEDLNKPDMINKAIKIEETVKDALNFINKIKTEKSEDPNSVSANWANMIETLNRDVKYMDPDLIKYTEESAVLLKKFKTTFSEDAKIQLLIDTMRHYQESFERINKLTAEWPKLKDSCENFIAEARRVLKEMDKINRYGELAKTDKMDSCLADITMRVRPFGRAENFSLIMKNAKNLHQILKVIASKRAAEIKQRSLTPTSAK